MTWLFRFIVFVLLFTIVRAVFSRLFGKNPLRPSAGQPRNRQAAPSMRSISHPVVKDPICGTYVEQDLALPLNSETGTLYFCSEKCREEYSKRVAVGVR